MNEPMHDLLAAAIDRRTHAFAEGRAFADAHESRVVRAIRTRRVATYASVGSAAVTFAVGAGLGVAALAGTSLNLLPAGQLSPDPSISIPSITPVVTSLAMPISAALVPYPYGWTYPEGETSRTYVFYVTLGSRETVPFPPSGLWYPGAPDVPSDAIIVAVSGDVEGYDLTDSDEGPADIQAWPAWTDAYDMVGNLDNYDFQYTADGQNASINWDVIGDVSDNTRWGIHYFLLNGELVTEAEGRANFEAEEITAWIGGDPDFARPDGPATIETTLVQVPLEDQYSTDGETSRTYAFYASTGAPGMLSFPRGGLWYPGIPDVPADAVVLVFHAGVDGFDLASDPRAGDMGIMPAWLNAYNLYDYDLVGDRDWYEFEWTEDGQNASIAWDIIGDVTDHTRWGIHYYLVEGEVVKEIDGRAAPNAVEVTAWFEPEASG